MISFYLYCHHVTALFISLFFLQDPLPRAGVRKRNSMAQSLFQNSAVTTLIVFITSKFRRINCRQVRSRENWWMASLPRKNEGEGESGGLRSECDSGPLAAAVTVGSTLSGYRWHNRTSHVSYLTGWVCYVKQFF